MSAFRGNQIEFKGGAWRYLDGVEVAKECDRACGHCGLANTPEGYDGCIGEVPGAINACCGHGEPNSAYVMFPGGLTIRGNFDLRGTNDPRTN